MSWENAHVLDGRRIELVDDGPCIRIKNTTRHLIIRNCQLASAMYMADCACMFYGIHLVNCTNVRVDNCTVSRCTEECILLELSCNNFIQDTDLVFHFRAILLDHSNNNTIRDNCLYYSNTTLYTISEHGSTGNLISGNHHVVLDDARSPRAQI